MAEDPGRLGKSPEAVTARQPKLRYQERIDVAETFADSIRSCIFDGQLLRIEFTVARFDDPGSLGVLEGKQVPVCRMVLNRVAIADLVNRLNQLGGTFRQAGIGAERAAEPARTSASSSAAAPASSSMPRPSSSLPPLTRR